MGYNKEMLRKPPNEPEYAGPCTPGQPDGIVQRQTPEELAEVIRIRKFVCKIDKLAWRGRWATVIVQMIRENPALIGELNESVYKYAKRQIAEKDSFWGIGWAYHYLSDPGYQRTQTTPGNQQEVSNWKSWYELPFIERHRLIQEHGNEGTAVNQWLEEQNNDSS